jgi:two-component system sensor histidine kinase YesM
LFPNGEFKNGFNVNKLPKLMQRAAFSFYGPHLSNSSGESSFVLSVSTPIEIIDGTDYSLYIETSSKTLTNILRRNQLGMDMFYTIVNDKGDVVYSEMTNYFPVGSAYKYDGSTNDMAKKGDYYILTKKSSSGWILAAALKKSAFNMEIKQWIFRMITIGVLLNCL